MCIYVCMYVNEVYTYINIFAQALIDNGHPAVEIEDVTDEIFDMVCMFQRACAYTHTCMHACIRGHWRDI